MKMRNLKNILRSTNLRKLAKPAVLCFSALLILNMLSEFSLVSGQTATSTTALHVKGKQLLTANGTPIVLKGMAYSYFAFNEGGCWLLPDGTVELNTWDPTGVQYTLDFMQASNCNVLRLMLCVKLWLDNSNNYQENIEYVITQAANRGFYTDLAFFNNDPGEGQLTGYLPWDDPGNDVLSSSADFVNLWRNVGSTLKNYPTVIFELWNEPNGDEATWFRVAQQCITAIRNAGATQPINMMYHLGVAYDWAYDGVNWINTRDPPFNMDWVKAYPLEDPSGNLIYSTHLYRFSLIDSSVSAPTQSGYQEAYNYSNILFALNVTGVLGVAAEHPLVIFEMGYNNWAYDSGNESTYFNATLTILDQYGIGYCIWALPPIMVSMEQWGIVQIGVLPTDYWVGYGVANYTLSTAGVLLVFHLGGMSYSDWLNYQQSGKPLPSPTPTPTSTATTNGISTYAPIIIILVAVVALIALIIWRTTNKSQQTKIQKIP
jgi:hypothetical protein